MFKKTTLAQRKQKANQNKESNSNCRSKVKKSVEVKKYSNCKTGGTSKNSNTPCNTPSELNIPNTENMVDLSSPGLCSALRLANEIKAATEEEKYARLHKKDQLKVCNTKVIQKLNIPFSEQIFKDLVDLQITDENILSGKTIVKTHSGLKKDKVFELSEYYKPNFSTQCLAKLSVPPPEIEKIQFYNGLDIYEKLNSLPKFS